MSWLTFPVEVVEAVDGDKVPPLQFMHFLLEGYIKNLKYEGTS